ncbi:biogenesis of lysosome-related organelles complex 1 subunit 5-like [Tubulanus polymorphus]|uniref:biogenesis of lysosome-related organelles complex 1 subunit 5-like n=1 Tax=Tubulanus polymorphus TaxID=672921 RepID=UPI003DA69078
MTTELIIKDIGEVHGRLFQHHAVIQAEISFFVKEFEEKRKDRELKRTQIIGEHIDQLKHKSLDETMATMKTLLSGIISTSETCSKMINKVADKEQDQKPIDLLEAERKTRSEEWASFIGEMCQKSSRVDSWFTQQKQEIQQYYNDLELKMHILPPPVES